MKEVAKTTKSNAQELLENTETKNTEQFSPNVLSTDLNISDSTKRLKPETKNRRSSEDHSNVDTSENFIKKISDNSFHAPEENSQTAANLAFSELAEKTKTPSSVPERAKKKSWYNVIYPSYKSRSKIFKKLFKEVPNDERLIVDYSCALQRDILLHGRLYVSQNYLCFYANIFRWETCLTIEWKDVTSITKEKTALVIPNAISVCTKKDKHFFASFTTRDKAFLMLFRVWQNTLMNKSMLPQEIWQWVHSCYGEELGLTSDDEDYIDPLTIKELAKKEDSDFHQKQDKNELQKYNKKTTSNLKKSVHYSDEERKSDDCSGKDRKREWDTMTSKDSDKINESEKLTSVGESNKRRASKNLHQKDEDLNKTSEILPTDISDSSESQENNMPFVSTVECTSAHEGRQLVHTILPINIDTLFNLLFSKSKFLLEFHESRKSTDLNFGEWVTSSTGLKTRTVNLTVMLAQSVGPKSSKVTESQVLRECSKPGELYSIDIDSTNAGIPYADSFGVLLHYCLVKTIDDNTMLSVHAQIKYKKSIWGVVKGFIEKNAWAGLEDFYNALLRSLQSEICIPPAKAKGRRPRKGPIVSVRPSVEEIPPEIFMPDIDEPILPIPVQVVSELAFNYKWMSISVIILLVFLIFINLILLLKLWRLETRFENDLSTRLVPNLLQIRNLPSNHNDWIDQIKQQDLYHDKELRKWQTLLKTASEFLKKASVVCQTIYKPETLNEEIEQINDEL